MNFNFVATTFRFREEDLMDELEDLFYEFGETDLEVNETNVSGLIVGKSSKDPQEFITFLRTKLETSAWEIRYLLRFIPIQAVVVTEIENIKNALLKLVDESAIPSNEPIKILIEKRHTPLTKMEIIDAVGPHLRLPVDLSNPKWIFLVEIIGRYSGISVLPANSMFSSMIEKRVSE
jgi:tRNA acetyltransferase TAN1